MNLSSKKIAVAASISGLLLPALASAQTAQNIIAVVDVFALILNRVVGIVIIFAIIWFIWGLAEYIFEESGDAKNRAKGRERMIMGVIALFVIISIWGLVRFLQNSLGIQGSSSNLRNEEIPYIGNPVQR